jgi:RNase P subunit RPR2
MGAQPGGNDAARGWRIIVEAKPEPRRLEKHVNHHRPRCPRCHSLDYESYKSRTNSDGVDVLYVWCRGCEYRYAILTF